MSYAFVYLQVKCSAYTDFLYRVTTSKVSRLPYEHRFSDIDIRKMWPCKTSLQVIFVSTRWFWFAWQRASADKQNNETDTIGTPSTRLKTERNAHCDMIVLYTGWLVSFCFVLFCFHCLLRCSRNDITWTDRLLAIMEAGDVKSPLNFHIF